MTVILAAGDYPKKNSKAYGFLESATRVVACDGAALRYIKDFGKGPDVVVGDCDSLKIPGIIKVLDAKSELIDDADQDTNDLEKAINLCRARGWNDIIVVGATGKREDHMIANVFLALEKEVMIVSDYGVFTPIEGEFSFKAEIGTPVSIFAPDSKTKVKSVGLAWPLDKHKFTNLYSAALNRTNAEEITITADRPILVYTAL